ncbi:hypothetical protein EFK50_06510 [Nocardioides marmoriginsengisoli]|uniref:Uncharacterized protein n=1 Tax=Nocardioides marmoriginsengisoli TaxID=661483 RepID=A0A3N0CL67_9ACTN|nr:hypothetical protein [Nocardioides marmoriginsengisoli]RNL64180.1 hypothetical protein EFK50_06510 [Nocardioides marmoriginsengisoli]
MIVQALDGRYVTVRRRWVPWRPRKRGIGSPFGPFSFVKDADDPVSFVVLLAAGIAAFLFGGIVLTALFLAGEVVLLLLLLVPLLIAARVLYVLPWTIEATYGDEVLGTVGVRGWRASSEKIREIAAAYQQGVDPFTTVG